MTLTGSIYFVAFYCETPLQSFLIALLPDGILSVIPRCSSFDCDFLDVIMFGALHMSLIVVLPASSFDFGTPR